MGFEHPSASEKIPLSVWNKILDMARDYYAGGRTAFKTGGGLLDPGREDETMVLVKNTTNAAVPQFGILQAGAPVVLPAASEPTFKERRVVTGTTPAAGLPFVITQEPIAAGSIGRAIDLGVTPVKLNVLDDAHQYADAAADTTQLQTQKGQGPARIWWKDAGVGGSIWSLVLLGPTGDDCGACLERLCIERDTNGNIVNLMYIDGNGNRVTIPDCFDDDGGDDGGGGTPTPTPVPPPTTGDGVDCPACPGVKIPKKLHVVVRNEQNCACLDGVEFNVQYVANGGLWHTGADGDVILDVPTPCFPGPNQGGLRFMFGCLLFDPTGLGLGVSFGCIGGSASGSWFAEPIKVSCKPVFAQWRFTARGVWPGLECCNGSVIVTVTE